MGTRLVDAEQFDDLVNAMWQLLDDMGKTGATVCGAAKAQARIAFQPFHIEENDGEMEYTLEQARTDLARSERN